MPQEHFVFCPQCDQAYEIVEHYATTGSICDQIYGSCYELLPMQDVLLLHCDYI
jgi:hypothetical protein